MTATRAYFPANPYSTMMAALRAQVVILEGTCHRALRTREDPLVRQALLTALTAFKPDPPADAPPLLKGLCNIARVRADLLKEDCSGHDEARLHGSLDRLCAALADVHHAIDRASLADNAVATGT